jgi:hypothetical protein
MVKEIMPFSRATSEVPRSLVLVHSQDGPIPLLCELANGRTGLVHQDIGSDGIEREWRTSVLWASQWLKDESLLLPILSHVPCSLTIHIVKQCLAVLNNPLAELGIGDDGSKGD